MPITLSFDELLAYTDEERAKWNQWFLTQPEPIWHIPLQPDGRFTTVWGLLDHIFVVEQRHLQRLQAQYPLPDSTGVTEGHWEELWEWALSTRQNLAQFVSALDEDQARVPRSVQLPSGPVAVTPRKLLFHILLHETRHWAQLAFVLRQAGLVPPGDHDLIFSTVLA